ncbi:MAG: type II secretion system GspH family protein [Gammaproteobacteria bacterium]|nr:type II secretion system GspH family protein [Gammaproteobacteria bacterium]NNJ73236.1 type II secretion system protein [Enterobacterales bacterium]
MINNCYIKESGFTLIELVITIVLIAVLAAVALPKFADLSGDSELAQVQGLEAAFKSGVNIVRTVFQSKGYTTRVQNLPGYGDGTIDTNNLGYPIGSNKGNGNENIGIGNFGCVGLWTALLDTPPSVAFNNDNEDFRSYRHTSNRVCSYVYRGSGDLGNQNTGLLVLKYDSRDGSVEVCGTRSDLPSC